MKIGIDIRSLMDKKYSGISVYTYSLLQEIFTQDTTNTYKLYYNSFKDVSNRLPKFNFPNVEIVRTKYPNKILNYILFKIFKYPKIDKLLDVDVMFLPHFNFIALSNQCKKIITIHDLAFLHFPYYFANRQNFWHRNINVKKMLHNFHKIIAVSDNTKHDITNLCHVTDKNIQTIYSGISSEYKILDSTNPNLARVKTKYNLPKNFILYLGNLEPRKNIEGLIESYELYRHEQQADFIMAEARALAEKNKVTLVIAGAESWKYRGIHDMARKSKFSSDIYFINYVDARDKVALYNLATIFVFPSFYEGFGFPPLEAMACGTPVIASATSSLPEIISEAGILINPYDIRAITESIKQVISDRDLQQHLINKGLERVKKYNWQKTAKEMLEAFEEIY